VRRSVAVSADNRGAGECETLLGSNDVHNSLPVIAEAEICKAECFDVLLQGQALCSRVRFLNEGPNVF